MAKHDTIRELLADPNGLSPEEAQTVKAHLQTCLACAASTAAYERHDALVRRIPLPEPPSGLRYAITDRVRHHQPSRFRRLSLPRFSTPTFAWIGALLFAIVALTVGTIHPLSQGGGSGVTDLGKPTNDLPGKGYLPLGKFHRASVTLRAHGKPEVFFMGLELNGATPGDQNTAVEQWPLVKALGQFGSLSGVTAKDRVCRTLPAGNGIPPGVRSCSDPTLDLAHARLSSRYVSFKDVMPDAQAFDHARFIIHSSLTTAERRLLKPYFHARRLTVNGDTYLNTPPFPLLIIGNYSQRALGNLLQGELDDKTHFGGQGPNGVTYPLGGLPFAKVQQSLRAGHPVDNSVYSAMVHDINAETNIITALVCHADGMRPGSVCSRPTIEKILKHVQPHKTSHKLRATVRVSGSSVTNLGKPTNALPADRIQPLGGFHRIGRTVSSGSRPELLWIGTEAAADQWSATERWSVIKALDQFGRLSRVSPASQPCSRSTGVATCDIATFEWSHAVYRSRYLTLVHKDLLNQQNHDLQHLNRSQLFLFKRYAEITRCGHFPVTIGKSLHARIVATAIFQNCDPSRHFPILLIGGYLQTQSDGVFPGDLETAVSVSGPVQSEPTGRSFAEIHAALVRGVNPPNSVLVTHVNAEANLITAMICHADHLQPHWVCSRTAIKTILRHVK